MPQIINTNVASLTSQRNLNRSQGELGVALQRLSSGLRINSAKDDAAGLAISERFTTQIRGLNQAIRNSNDAISLAQTAEGALNEYGNILQRVRELAVQSANATNSASDRKALQGEVNQMLAELQRVATTTQFNGQNIIDGTFTGAQFQVGANANQTIIVNVANSQTEALGSYQVGDTAQAVSASALVGGDLTINGIDVGVSVSGSAEDKATAINSVASQTGVTASASSEVTSTETLRRGQALSSGDLLINGVSVGAVSGSNNIATQGANIASAINNLTNQTGVIATSDLATGALTLTSSTGKDIAITSANGDTGYNRLENAMGFDVSATDTATPGTSTLATTAAGAAGATVISVTTALEVGDTLTVGGVEFTMSAAANSATNIQVDGTATVVEGNDNIKAAIDLAVTAGTIKNATITATAGVSTTVTSQVATSSINHIDATYVGGGAGVVTTPTAGNAGMGVGNTLNVGGLTYEFVMPGGTAAGSNVGVELGADDATNEANIIAAINSQYTQLNTNIQATAVAGITLTADLLGDAGDLSVLATIDLTAGDAGTATALVGAIGVDDTNGAGTSLTQRGTIELNSSEQYIIDGNATSKVGLQSATATLNSINVVDISTVEGANSAISVLDGALDQINSIRGDLGAVQNRFESTIKNLSVTSENLSAARSRIRDADYAQETAALTRAQILQQAGVSILSQANSLPQMVLSLLQ